MKNSTTECFDEAQLYYIKEGIDRGYDVSNYAYSNIEPETMSVALWGLDHGVKLENQLLERFDSEQLGWICHGLCLKNEFDLTKYIHPAFYREQVEEIYHKLLKNEPVEPIDPSVTDAEWQALSQMRRDGLPEAEFEGETYIREFTFTDTAMAVKKSDPLGTVFLMTLSQGSVIALQKTEKNSFTY